MSDHGGIRMVYPRQAAVGAPIEMVVAHSDGHCEVCLGTDEKWLHVASRLVQMINGNMQARGRDGI